MRLPLLDDFLDWVYGREYMAAIWAGPEGWEESQKLQDSEVEVDPSRL